MPERRILPLGFIDKLTEDGAIIMLTDPRDSHNLEHETPVTLRTRSITEAGATARARGLITAVEYVTATFKVVETRTDSKWPDGEQILRLGTPVYKAMPNSFNPDVASILTDEQAAGLRSLANRYKDATRPGRPTPDHTRRVSRNGTSPDH